MEIWDGSIKWQDKTMPDYQRLSIDLSFTELPCGSGTYFLKKIAERNLEVSAKPYRWMGSTS